MQYNRVKIGAVYLTNDGLVTGTPCKVEVEGLDKLRQTYSGRMAYSADNTPYAFLFPQDGQGVLLTLRPLVLMDTQLDAIQGILDDFPATGDAIDVEITDGDLGDFTLTCVPVYPSPIKTNGQFNNGRIYGVTIEFAVLTKA